MLDHYIHERTVALGFFFYKIIACEKIVRKHPLVKDIMFVMQSFVQKCKAANYDLS